MMAALRPDLGQSSICDAHQLRSGQAILCYHQLGGAKRLFQSPRAVPALNFFGCAIRHQHVLRWRVGYDMRAVNAGLQRSRRDFGRLLILWVLEAWEGEK